MNQTISIARYGLAYLLWAVTVALAVVALLVWRSTAFIILGMTPWDRYAEYALNQFGFLLIAIVTLGMIIFSENYYRTGVDRHQLWKRFFQLTMIEVLVLAIAHVIQWIGGIVLDFAQSPVSPLILIGELVVAILLFFLQRQVQQRANSTL